MTASRASRLFIGARNVSKNIDHVDFKNLNARLPELHSRDELAALSNTLNQMLIRIEAGYQSVRSFTANAAHELRSPVALLRAETELQSVFPGDYRACTLASNGGELSTADDDWQVFPVFDDSDRKRAARSANHIVRKTAAARQWRGFPTAGVAFAANGKGDLLVFLPHEDDPAVLAPAVYFWDHETGKSVYIAASLSKLVHKI